MTNAQSSSTADDVAETALSRWAPSTQQLCGGQIQIQGEQLQYRPNLLARLRGDRPFQVAIEKWNEGYPSDEGADRPPVRGSAAGTLRVLLKGLEDRSHPNARFHLAIVRERKVLSCRQGLLVLSASRLAFATMPGLWSHGVQEQRLLSELNSVYVRAGALHLEWKEHTRVLFLDQPEKLFEDIVHNWLCSHGFNAESPAAVLELDRAACFGHVALPGLVWRGPKGEVELAGADGQTCAADGHGDHLRIGPSERLLYSLRMRDKVWFQKHIATRSTAPGPIPVPFHRQLPAGNATLWTAARIVARGDIPVLHPSQDQVDLLLIPMGPLSFPTLACLFVESDGARKSVAVLAEAAGPEDASGHGIYRIHINRLRQPAGSTTAHVRLSDLASPRPARLLHQSARRLVLVIGTEVPVGTDVYVELPGSQTVMAVVDAVGCEEREGPVLILQVAP